MALTAARAQSDRDRGEKSTSLRAQYWLERSRVQVDGLFKSIKRNSDATARKLATQMMEEAEILEAPEVNLTALPDEHGSDLTSGRQNRRLVFGGVVDRGEQEASK